MIHFFMKSWPKYVACANIMFPVDVNFHVRPPWKALLLKQNLLNSRKKIQKKILWEISDIFLEREKLFS